MDFYSWCRFFFSRNIWLHMHTGSQLYTCTQSHPLSNLTLVGLSAFLKGLSTNWPSNLPGHELTSVTFRPLSPSLSLSFLLCVQPHTCHSVFGNKRETDKITYASGSQRCDHCAFFQWRSHTYITVDVPTPSLPPSLHRHCIAHCCPGGFWAVKGENENSFSLCLESNTCGDSIQEMHSPFFIFPPKGKIWLTGYWLR